jgi:hypothetical protein
VPDEKRTYVIEAGLSHFGGTCKWQTRPVSAEFFSGCAKALKKLTGKPLADEKSFGVDKSVRGDAESISHAFEEEEGEDKKNSVQFALEGLIRADEDTMLDAIQDAVKNHVPNKVTEESMKELEKDMAPKEVSSAAAYNRGRSEAQSLLDLIMPRLYIDATRLSDTEASTLYKLWNSSPTGARAFRVPEGIDSRTIFALKTKGYVSGFGDSLELTDKGRKILVEMVTNEPNALEKKSEISYSKIQEKKAHQRPRQSLVKRASAEVKKYNLSRSRKNAGNDNKTGEQGS